MYAPHEHGQHLCHRVPSEAGSGFFTMAPRWIGVPAADCSCSRCGKDAPAWREALRRVPGVEKNDAEAGKVLHVARHESKVVFKGRGSDHTIRHVERSTS